MINVPGNFLQGLRNAPPHISTVIKKGPGGSLAGAKAVDTEIPPLNTDIQFASVLPAFSLAKHRGLAAIQNIPEEFDWGHQNDGDSDDIRRKKSLISKPGNQATCGSCWAISGAGILSDNFVVSGLVDWKPDLSTTWILMCYPQGQCKGGNPAKLFEDVAKGGVSSDHCIDYSWCLQNEICNGSALKHFDKAKAAQAVSQMNGLIPSPCGCYENTEHYLYMPDKNSKLISIGSDGVTEKNIAQLVKAQIYTKGPVMGGFIVFDNFMPGTFSQTNGGVYLENATYDAKGEILDWKNPHNYKGAHAIAIIGWGIARNILTGPSKREDVPYWYCRNSWKPTWGDGGYFKMAMYPWNKLSQFEKIVTITDQSGGRYQGGGIIFPIVTKKPVKKTFSQLAERFRTLPRDQPESYYKESNTRKPNDPDTSGGVAMGMYTNWKVWVGIVIGILIISILFYYLKRRG